MLKNVDAFLKYNIFGGISSGVIVARVKTIYNKTESSVRSRILLTYKNKN